MADSTILVVTTAVAVLIAALSLLRGDTGTMALVPPGLHRVGHFLLYILLGVLCVLTMQFAEMALILRMLTGFLIATAFGLTMELLQRFRPGRTPSYRDAVVNAAGAAIGAVATLVWLISGS